MSYDVKCYDVALSFLDDFVDVQLSKPRQEIARDLAQKIQDCVEVFLAEKGLTT